jgi:hypothetical protein
LRLARAPHRLGARESVYVLSVLSVLSLLAARPPRIALHQADMIPFYLFHHSVLRRERGTCLL